MKYEYGSVSYVKDNTTPPRKCPIVLAQVLIEVYGIMRIKREHEEANVLDVCVTRTMPTSVMQRQISMGKPLAEDWGVIDARNARNPEVPNSVPNVLH